jgi:hypothetical protein
VTMEVEQGRVRGGAGREEGKEGEREGTGRDAAGNRSREGKGGREGGRKGRREEGRAPGVMPQATDRATKERKLRNVACASHNLLSARLLPSPLTSLPPFLPPFPPSSTRADEGKAHDGRGEHGPSGRVYQSRGSR